MQHIVTALNLSELLGASSLCPPFYGQQAVLAPCSGQVFLRATLKFTVNVSTLELYCVEVYRLQLCSATIIHVLIYCSILLVICSLLHTAYDFKSLFIL